MDALTRRLMMLAARRSAEFVGYSVSSTSGDSPTLTIPKPPQLRARDLMIALMAPRNSFTWSGASGWTELIDSGGDTAIRVAVKTASAEEPASYAFTASASVGAVGQILAFRRAKYDTIGAMAHRTSNGDLAIAGIVSAGGFLIGAAATEDDGTNHSTPDGMTLIARKTNADVAMTCWIEKVPAGATGDRITSVSQANFANSSNGILVAVKS